MEYKFSVTPRLLIIFIFCCVLFILIIFFIGTEVGKFYSSTSSEGSALNIKKIELEAENYKKSIDTSIEAAKKNTK
jgi:hypothetical protein